MPIMAWMTPKQLRSGAPKLAPGPTPRTALRRKRVRSVAAGETSIVETLKDHYEQLNSSEVHVARLRTALKFYAAAPRIAAFSSPKDVADAFQNAHWRDKCRRLMDAAAEATPRESRSFLLLQQGRFAMRLDQRHPNAGDAAQSFLKVGPGPKFSRDSVSVLDVFKTEIAALNVSCFDADTCAWLDGVAKALQMYESAESYVALEDPASLDIDLETLSIAAYHLMDILDASGRPSHAALGEPRNLERARAALVEMCLLRIDEVGELVE